MAGSDVINAIRIQKERFSKSIEMPLGYSENLRINRQTINNYVDREAIIIHPLPRDNRAGAYDLNEYLKDLLKLAIFRQADNGVTMRMALFSCVLGVEQTISQCLSDNHAYAPDYYSDNDANYNGLV